MNLLEIKSSEHVEILEVNTERIKMEWLAPESNRAEGENKPKGEARCQAGLGGGGGGGNSMKHRKRK